MQEEAEAWSRKYFSDGMDVTELEHDHYREFFITAEVPEGISPAAIREKIAGFLNTNGNARITKADLFTSSAEWAAEFQTVQPDLPLTAICACSCRPGHVAGVYVHAVSGIGFRSIVKNGQLVGTVYEDDLMKCLALNGIGPAGLALTRDDQARSVFQWITELLAREYMNFTEVVRTWLYIDDIISWYPDFNRVRSEFFKTHHVFDGLVPASTGISGRNPTGSALTAGVFAVAIKDQSARIHGIPSPLQCPALEYGSSFSRAVELSTPDCRRLLISGTASIDINGQSLHPGDVRSQIDQTMKVVGAILNSRKMDWDNICRAIVYFKRSADYYLFDEYLTKQHITEFPMLMVEADICRDELLFEIEADAISIET